MKRFFLCAAIIVSGLGMRAEVIEPAQMGIRYYMPKTELTLSIDYTETCLVPGKYAPWAQELLGVDNAIQDDSVSYVTDDVYLTTKSVADTSRAYTIVPETGMQMQCLSITQEGLLYGYNVFYSGQNGRNNHHRAKTGETQQTQQLVSLLEETIKCDSLPCQARSVAKQIYQLRDNRIYLLSGDAENQPADGVSMKTILEEIDRQEKALVQLFMGTEIRRTKHVELAIDPATEMDSVMICIGEDSIRVCVETFGYEQAPVDTKKKKKAKKDAPVPSQLYYNLPGKTHVTVSKANETLLDEMIPVAQLGISVPLSANLFDNEDARVKIRFDVNTGNVLYIQQR